MFFRKRILIHTAWGHEEYLKIANKLAAAGIVFKTKSRYSGHFMGGNSYLPMSFRDKTVQYDIYVNREDQYKAHQAIHNKET
jgi:hypothetical protein